MKMKLFQKIVSGVFGVGLMLFAAVESSAAAPAQITNFASDKLYLSEGAENLFASGDFETTPEGGWSEESFLNSGIVSISQEKHRSGSNAIKIAADAIRARKSITETEWKTYKYIINTGALSSDLTVTLKTLSGTTRFKNISLTEIGSDGDNLILNGDFSSGTTYNIDNWEGEGIGAQKLEDVADGIYLKISNKTKTVYQTVSLKANTDYMLVFQGKVESDGDEGVLSIGKKKSAKTAVMQMTLSRNTDYVIAMSLLGEFLSEDNLGSMQILLTDGETGAALDTGYLAFDGICPTRWDNEWHRRAVEFTTGDSGIIGINIIANSASCYIDDITVCEAVNATNIPQASDIAADPSLKTTYNSAILAEEGTHIVKCDSDRDLVGDLSGLETILRDNLVDMTRDYKNPLKTVLNYSNTFVLRRHSPVQWIKVEKSTRYIGYVKIRGEEDGNAAFTVITNSKSPVRLLKYSPANDGKWQSYCFVIDTNDDTTLGLGFYDGGGSISIADMVFCKYSEAVISDGGYPENNIETEYSPDTFEVDFSQFAYPAGDVNTDTDLNAKDLTLLKKHLLSIEDLTDNSNADCNEDGNINIVDLVCLKKLISK